MKLTKHFVLVLFAAVACFAADAPKSPAPAQPVDALQWEKLRGTFRAAQVDFLLAERAANEATQKWEKDGKKEALTKVETAYQAMSAVCDGVGKVIDQAKLECVDKPKEAAKPAAKEK